MWEDDLKRHIAKFKADRAAIEQEKKRIAEEEHERRSRFARAFETVLLPTCRTFMATLQEGSFANDASETDGGFQFSFECVNPVIQTKSTLELKAKEDFSGWDVHAKPVIGSAFSDSLPVNITASDLGAWLTAAYAKLTQ